MRAALSNIGPVKKSITATGQTGATFESSATYKLPDCAECRDATGFTYGTENWAYNADGTAKSVTIDAMEANGLGDRYFLGSKGCALYSADKTGSTASKIERYLRGITGSVQVDSDGDIIIDSQGSMLDAE